MLHQDYIEFIEYEEKLLSIKNSISKIKDETSNQAVIKVEKLGNLSL
jgi:hypothetical protein